MVGGGDEVLVVRQWYGSPSRNDGADTGWTKTDSRGINRCVTWESNPNLEPFLTGQSFRVALKTKEKKTPKGTRTDIPTITVLKGMLECVHTKRHPGWRGFWSKVTVELPLLHLLCRHASLHNAAPFTPPASPWRMRPSKTRNCCSAHE